MGAILQLIEMLGETVRRGQGDSKIYDWMRAVSTLVDNNLSNVTQTSWFISNDGLNENTGVGFGSPIPEAERARRWGRSPVLQAQVTVTYLDTPTSDVNYGDVRLERDAGLKIVGTQTQIGATSALTGVTAINRSTQSALTITDTNLGVNGFAPSLGKFIVLTTGANAGAWARIVKDLGSKTARASPFVKFVDIVTSQNPGATVTPTVGDQYKIIDVPTLNVGDIRIRTGSTATVAAPFANAFMTDSVRINGGSSVPLVGLPLRGITLTTAFYWANTTEFFNVSLNGLNNGTFNVFGGAFRGQVSCNLRTPRSGPGFYAGSLGHFGEIAEITVASGQLWITGDMISENSYFDLFGGSLIVSGLALFDTPGPICMLVHPNTSLLCRDKPNTQPGSLLWGTNNVGYGVATLPGGSIYVQRDGVTKLIPSVNGGLGVGRELLLSDTDLQWSTLPNFTTSLGANVGLTTGNVV